MTNILLFFLFFVGFLLLIKGADFLVEGACSLAKRLRVSGLVIGLTVVAFGTSTPELLVNIVASYKGSTEIAISNILGSNTANILLILGLSAVIYTLKVTHNTIWKEIPLTFLAALLVLVMTNDQWIDKSASSFLSRSDGLVLLAFFVIFLYYTVSISRTQGEDEEFMAVKQFGLGKSWLWIFIGLVALFIGGNFVVKGAVQLARQLRVSEALIGLTIVALGTSLPELATSAVAAYRRKTDIAVGNIVGSNIFNIFFILGVSATIRPLPLSLNYNFDIVIMILASLLLFICMFTGGKRLLDRWEGVLFVILYSVYIIFLIKRG